jgi:hypothetical protein
MISETSYFLPFLFAISSLLVFILRIVPDTHKKAAIAPGYSYPHITAYKLGREAFLLTSTFYIRKKTFPRNISKDWHVNPSTGVGLYVHALIIKAFLASRVVGTFSLS